MAQLKEQETVRSLSVLFVADNTESENAKSGTPTRILSRISRFAAISALALMASCGDDATAEPTLTSIGDDGSYGVRTFGDGSALDFTATAEDSGTDTAVTAAEDATTTATTDAMADAGPTPEADAEADVPADTAADSGSDSGAPAADAPSDTFVGGKIDATVVNSGKDASKGDTKAEDTKVVDPNSPEALCQAMLKKIGEACEENGIPRIPGSGYTGKNVCDPGNATPTCVPDKK